MIVFKNIYKKYNNKLILNNISFHAKNKKTIGLAGSSGCGKTTLLRCIQGLEKIDEGEITYKGVSTFMFQDFQLFPHMTVLENLLYPSKRLNKDERYESIKKADLFLSKLKIEDKKNDYPKDLSGGQKQRVALARALMINPDILLCDEPTSGLDIATINDVIDLFKIVQEMGITIIVASHDLDFLTKAADQIIMLKQGSIVCDVLKEDFSIPLLKTFYED